MKISVLICTYNRKELLRTALEALFQVDFSSGEYEIVLVDDGSTDGTGDMVKAIDSPCRLQYCYQSHSGPAKARNVGIRRAEGEVILIIDDDTFAERGLLQAHWAIQAAHPRCVVMGWVNHIDRLAAAGKPPRFKMADISTSFFCTSNVSVRKSWLLDAGWFDEDFTEYGWEDVELGARLRQLGLRRIGTPRAIVYHYKQSWLASDLPRKYQQAAASGRSALIYLKKYPRLRARLSTNVYQPLMALNNMLRVGERLFERVVARVGDKPLCGFPALCAQLLVSFRYYEAIKNERARQHTP